MRTPLAYGIDYGTTNSSISIAYPDRVEVLELNPDSSLRHSLPSIPYLHRDGLRLAGTEAVEQFAVTGGQRTSCERCSLVFRERVGRTLHIHSDCRQYKSGSGCLDSRLMGELKSELSNDIFEKTHSWARDFEMEDLTAVIIAELKRRADKRVGKNVNRVVIGYPVAFFGAAGDDFHRLQSLAEDRLRRPPSGLDSRRWSCFQSRPPQPWTRILAMDSRLRWTSEGVPSMWQSLRSGAVKEKWQVCRVLL